MSNISNVENTEINRHQKHHHPQKIIIPKDTINPNDTTVIEIPSHMRSRRVVIAQKDMSVKTGGQKQRKTTEKRGQRQKKINFKESKKVSDGSGSHSPDSTSQTMLCGPSHSSNLRFADEKDIERLLDDLERYYCSQRQLLLKAKLSRASTCSCGSSNLQRIQTCSQSAVVSSDNRNYDHFKSGLNSNKTSEEKLGSCTRERETRRNYDHFKSGLNSNKTSEEKLGSCTRERETRSAPQSQVLLGIDSDLIVKVPCNKKISCTSQAGPSDNQQANSSCSKCGADVEDKEERDYKELLYSKKVFSRQAEELRKALNALEPDRFKSKRKFKENAEILRKKLKKMYDDENNIDLPDLDCSGCECQSGVTCLIEDED